MRFFDPLPNTRGLTAEFTRWEFELMINEIRDMRKDPHIKLMDDLRNTLMIQSIVDVQQERIIIPLSYKDLSELGTLMIKVLEHQHPKKDLGVWKELQSRAARKTHFHGINPFKLAAYAPADPKHPLAAGRPTYPPTYILASSDAPADPDADPAEDADATTEEKPASSPARKPWVSNERSVK